MLTHEYDFSNAIVGTDVFGNYIYSFDKMVYVLTGLYSFSREEAEQYLRNKIELEYNDGYSVIYRYY
jgi:hypothetical protein